MSTKYGFYGLCLSFFGLGLVRRVDKLTVPSEVEGQTHYKSVTYRMSSGGFVYRVLDGKRLPMPF
jgi:hypothetical protein